MLSYLYAGIILKTGWTMEQIFHHEEHHPLVFTQMLGILEQDNQEYLKAGNPQQSRLVPSPQHHIQHAVTPEQALKLSDQELAAMNKATLDSLRLPG